MASNPEGGTAEAVAYTLVQNVMNMERRSFKSDPAPGWQPADRKYLLDLYAECLQAASGKRPPQRADSGS